MKESSLLSGELEATNEAYAIAKSQAQAVSILP